MDLEKIPFIGDVQTNWSQQTVLLRCDLNVPIIDGTITDDTRINSCIETINFLIKNRAKIVIISHYGQIKEELDEKTRKKYSLFWAVNALEKKLGKHVFFSSDPIGPSLLTMINTMEGGDVMVLENVRFYSGETKNDSKLAQDLASMGTFYVNEAFSVSHRNHASIVTLPTLMPNAAGFGLYKEYQMINDIVQKPHSPFLAVIGGAKVSSKLKLLSFMLPKVDMMTIGGAMANTFLKAKGYEMRSSLVEDDLIPLAQKLMKEYGEKIYLPCDVVVCDEKTFDGNETVDVGSLKATQQAVDIGSKTIDHYMNLIKKAQTLIMNGPMGIFEDKRFALGSRAITQCIGQQTQKGQLFSLAGGGDTLALLEQEKQKNHFSFLSTGGGAFLACLEGTPLPGIRALMR